MSSGQLFLPLESTLEHFQLLHGRHQEAVAVCSKAADCWTQDLLEHDGAAYVLTELAAGHDVDVYQSQHGFNLAGKRRTVRNVAALTSFYVDVDCYKKPESGLVGVSLHELRSRIEKDFPWLPTPTAVYASGQGFYLSWLFQKVIAPDRLALWQEVQDLLIELFKDYGADGAARDAARVLRPVGSTHTRSGSKVEGEFCSGMAVNFYSFCTLVKREAGSRINTPAASRINGTASPSPADFRLTTERQRGTKEGKLKLLKLAQDRLHDCNVLAELRGSPRMTDCRHRLGFVHAVTVTNFTGTMQQAQAEIDAFAGQHFSEPERYHHATYRSVLDRLAHQLQGVRRLTAWGVSDSVYHLTNKRIIDTLEVTPEEQRHLRTFISTQEKYRRKVEKRRREGVAPRDEYLAPACARRKAAVELQERFWSHADIATQLGCTRQAVSRLLKAG